jgi:hypothetical protein
MRLTTIYHAPELIRNNQGSPQPIAYFVVFFLIGGMIGALTAGPTVIAARSFEVPLPRNYRQAQPVDA